MNKPAPAPATALVGMKQICDYYGRSEASILRLILNDGFPASKVLGVWESDKELIDQWRKENIRNQTDKK